MIGVKPQMVRAVKVMVEPVVLVHGGAGDIPNSRVAPKLAGVRRAARRGYKVLCSGGSVIDAVQSAVQDMEDDGYFNAGYGSVLNADGEVEMDAIIMEGKELKAGSVAAMRNVAHPVDVACLFMEKTPRVMLVGEGAKPFANEQGVPEVPIEKLVTEFAKACLERTQKKGVSGTKEFGYVAEDSDVGTVGAVAVDAECHVAAATSTGGICGKLVGRVGDTPLPGCGGYADDNIGAVSTTGQGESIMRFCLARTILTLMEQGKSASKATVDGCKAMTERVGSSAGAITVSNKGEVGIGFTSDRMAWAYQCRGKVYSGVGKDDQFCEDA